MNFEQKLPDTPQVRGLGMFIELTKIGAKWHGDVMSRKWSECLFFEDDFVEQRALEFLAHYAEGVDYKLDGHSVWIA